MLENKTSNTIIIKKKNSNMILLQSHAHITLKWFLVAQIILIRNIWLAGMIKWEQKELHEAQQFEKTFGELLMMLITHQI